MAICVLALAVATSGAASTRTSKAITAPAHIGVFTPHSANKLENSDAAGKSQIKHLAVWNHRSAQDISTAYGGAPAVVESYTDAKLEHMFSLVAVRASSPGLFALYVDPKFLGLVRPLREVQKFGAAECLIENDGTPIGQQPAATSVHTLECRRTGPHLTVSVPSPPDAIGNHPSAVAAIVNQAWTLISAE